jgi:hypothetical protein
LLGMGLGPTSSLFTLAVQSTTERSKLGMATSANQFFRNMGGTIGAALFGAIQSAHLSGITSQLPAAARNLPPQLAQAAANPNLLSNPAALAKVRPVIDRLIGESGFQSIVTVVKAALSSAVAEIFLLASVLSLIALLVTLFLPNLNIRDLTVKAGEAARLSRDPQTERQAQTGSLPAGAAQSSYSQPARRNS